MQIYKRNPGSYLASRVTPSVRVQVLPCFLLPGDFGIAKQLLEAGAQAHTMVGTPYYMAPELLQARLSAFKQDLNGMGSD